jgi:prepilin-type N-terminal cleavage/methylation domain-containing protein
MKIGTYKNRVRNLKGGILRRRPGASSPHRTAVTLIELMVVIFILAVLAALVVGGGMWIRRASQEKQTITSQKIVMTTIRAYYDVYEEYPNDSTNPPWDPAESGKLLLGHLKGEEADADADKAKVRKATMEILRGLPEDALPGAGAAIKDGFERPMAYQRDGGLGGGPVVISAGPDGEFGDDASPEYKSDNIRSDKQ